VIILTAVQSTTVQPIKIKRDSEAPRAINTTLAVVYYKTVRNSTMNDR
jgi:hypothetical protein